MTGLFLNMTTLKKRLLLLLTLLMIAMITALEYWTGEKIKFTIVYLIPVLLAASISKLSGMFIAIASATIAIAASYTLQYRYDNPLYYFWEFTSHMAIFLLAATLRANLLAARERERKLARIDPLTGAFNGLAFREIAQAEINRTIRYKRPLTMAYIDVDNFKTVNDTLGHSEGDVLLRAIVSEIMKRLRTSDIVARLGGDEFAVLLPETGQTSALTAISQIKSSLTEEVRKRNWPVTFSIGVLTIIDTKPTVNHMIEAADALMYAAKQVGKNAIRTGLYREPGRV